MVWVPSISFYLNKTRRTPHYLRFHGGGCGLFCVLALILASSFGTSLGTSIKDLLTILVHLELYNAHLRGMDTNINRGSICLFTLNAFNVHTEFLAIALNNLADLLAFVMTTYNLDFVILANGHVLHSIFWTKIFGEGRGHQLPPDVRWSGEMAFALLLRRRRHVLVQLHFESRRMISVYECPTGKAPC